MLAVAALLGIFGLLALGMRRQSDSSFADPGGNTPVAPLTPQASQSLAATVSELMAQNPRNRGEAEGLAMMMEDLAGRIQGTNPLTAQQLRRRAGELRTVMVSFPDPNAVPGGQQTVSDVASILTGAPRSTVAPSPAPTPSPVTPAPATPAGVSLASEVTANLRSRGRRYDRALMKRFQRSVGLPDSGTYGTASREALEYLGESPPPEYTRTRTRFTPPSGYTTMAPTTGPAPAPAPTASRSSSETDAQRAQHHHASREAELRAQHGDPLPDQRRT